MQSVGSKYTGTEITVHRLPHAMGSRATIETLNELKNPRQANFIRQQNVAHQQQVNNGMPIHGAPLHAHGSQEAFQSNELLEAQNGERLDTGATCKAGGADKDMEAVEVVDRAENGGGKSGKQSKRAAARPKIRSVS